MPTYTAYLRHDVEQDMWWRPCLQEVYIVKEDRGNIMKKQISEQKNDKSHTDILKEESDRGLMGRSSWISW